jgi:thiol:disulfide interchange protein DsbD
MPCVLPILGLKAIQLQKHKPDNPVKEAFFYWLGIFSSLQILFGILMGLKLSGKAVGWGFQLQSPIVIQLLILLFIIISAINLDILRIPLPKFASKKSNGMFFNGVLTTIVATPCTAPFLGSALAFALFQSFFTGIGIFLCISVGLAAPMILIIINPMLSQFLPRTKAWNNQFKYSLNFGFVFTIGWLMWILNAQINIKNYITFYTTLILLLTILIVRSKQFTKKILIVFTTTILLCTIPIITNKPALSEWKPYTPELVELLEVNKKPFFIDVTAKWCVTCQTNKLAVLNTKKADQLFESKNIALIIADWTNKTDDITNLLTKHDKVSIPTYIYYDGNNYTIFGDILTFTKLRENLNK